MKFGDFLDKYRFYIAGILVLAIVSGWAYLFFSKNEDDSEYKNEEIALLKAQVSELKNQVESISYQNVVLGESDGNENADEKNDVSDVININTASSEELQTLSGIGAVRAQDIITYRETNNGFASISEIQNVKGIGPATFAKISSLITIE